MGGTRRRSNPAADSSREAPTCCTDPKCTVTLDIAAMPAQTKTPGPSKEAGGLILRQFMQEKEAQRLSLEGGKREAEADSIQVSATAAERPFLSMHCCGIHVQLSRVQFWIVLALLCLVILAATLGGALSAAKRASNESQSACSPDIGPEFTKNLPFVDDFTTLDPCVWSFDIGDGSDYGLVNWGNGELQCYSNSSSIVSIIPNPDKPNDGLLRIKQVYTQQPQTCSNTAAATSAKHWTSGKIHTKNKKGFQWTAGSTGACTPIVVESRIKLPYMAGRWSAFWMMPQPQWGVDVAGCPAAYPAGPPQSPECGRYGPWPRSGEIDIMEQVNQENKTMGTVHYANVAGQHVYLTGSVQLPAEVKKGWNVYKAVWGCDSIMWYVNDQQYHQVTRQQLEALWRFDQPFFLILNTAVGGILTGYTDPVKQESEMLVDYVKVSYMQ